MLNVIHQVAAHDAASVISVRVLPGPTYFWKGGATMNKDDMANSLGAWGVMKCGLKNGGSDL